MEFHPIQIRPAARPDAAALIKLRAELWPAARNYDHQASVEALLSGAPLSTMPLEIFVADREGTLLGFIEVGLRSHADGCDGTQPVGYVEGWYVGAEYRKLNIGRALFEAAENWARGQGCMEMASDTWLDSLPAQKAHESLGFEIVDRCVHYRKSLK